jgi:hypothetical protein
MIDGDNGDDEDDDRQPPKNVVVVERWRERWRKLRRI